MNRTFFYHIMVYIMPTASYIVIGELKMKVRKPHDTNNIRAGERVSEQW